MEVYQLTETSIRIVYEWWETPETILPVLCVGVMIILVILNLKKHWR